MGKTIMHLRKIIQNCLGRIGANAPPMPHPHPGCKRSTGHTVLQWLTLAAQGDIKLQPYCRNHYDNMICTFRYVQCMLMFLTMSENWSVHVCTAEALPFLSPSEHIHINALYTSMPCTHLLIASFLDIEMQTCMTGNDSVITNWQAIAV